MSHRDSSKDPYKGRNIPWDVGKPDSNLTEMVTKFPIPRGKALEIGCGTGDNAVWLAKQGFIVIGYDLSEIAIEKAKEKASQANVKCTFFARDFLGHDIQGAPFDFVFDRGCFHLFPTDGDRTKYAEKVASLLRENGLWLSLIGNADDTPRDHGPPRLSAQQITGTVESLFEILSLTSSHFTSNHPNPSRAWVCLMQKRKEPQNNPGRSS